MQDSLVLSISEIELLPWQHSIWEKQYKCYTPQKLIVVKCIGYMK